MLIHEIYELFRHQCHIFAIAWTDCDWLNERRRHFPDSVVPNGKFEIQIRHKNKKQINFVFIFKSKLSNTTLFIFNLRATPHDADNVVNREAMRQKH